MAGLIWAAVAPRPLLQEIAHGEAELVNAETTSYIVADAWFALIAAVGAALLALWVGENIGLGTYNHLLATSPTGAFFHSSLALGAKSTLAFWPLCTSGVILLAEAGARRSAQAAGKARHRQQEEPGASGMWTPEPPGGHAP